MKFFSKNNKPLKGFSLLEVMVAIGISLLFIVGVYGGIQLVFKIVYNSRLKILETAILSEKIETIRNLPFENVGILSGVPAGVLPYSTTTVRNGITFNIITTVRNIDDPFDGTVTSSSMDTSPADYKLVELSAICQNCPQTKPVIINTIIAPRNLEGASNNGSLFIHVFDANGLDVQGASVHVVNTARVPNTVIDDVTDNDGMLRIIDTPTGTLSYHITVTKSDYSSDYTVSSSVSNSNPTKPPSNVASQTVTEISFSIDRLGDLTLNTINPSCSAIGSASFNIYGEKVIGNNPAVYKYDQDLTTNGSGQYSFGSMEWDKYHLSTSGTIYDIAGSQPVLPIDLTPGLTQEAQLILRPHTANSMLVFIKDAGTGQPLSSATVRLTKTGYDQSLITDIGYTRQTDWSGGSGQVMFLDETAYYSDNSNLITSDGTLTLKKVGGSYLSEGILESSTFDLGDNATYRNVVFLPLSQPASTTILFQLATNSSSTPASWSFIGPDGTNSTYYTTTSSLIYSGHNNQRYMRYKVFLRTQKSSATPALSEVLFTYTNQCVPPGQAFFSSLDADTYTLEVSRSGYETASDSNVIIGGNMMEVVELSVQ